MFAQTEANRNQDAVGWTPWNAYRGGLGKSELVYRFHKGSGARWANEELKNHEGWDINWASKDEPHFPRPWHEHTPEENPIKQHPKWFNEYDQVGDGNDRLRRRLYRRITGTSALNAKTKGGGNDYL